MNADHACVVYRSAFSTAMKNATALIVSSVRNEQQNAKIIKYRMLQ